MVAIFPLHQGCVVIQAIVSKPSSPSERYFVNLPSDRWVPLQSW